MRQFGDIDTTGYVTGDQCILTFCKLYINGLNSVHKNLKYNEIM